MRKILLPLAIVAVAAASYMVGRGDYFQESSRYAPGRKEMVSAKYRRISETEAKKIFPKRHGVRFETGLAYDLDGDGSHDYIGAFTIVKKSREDNVGFIEAHSGRDGSVMGRDNEMDLWNLSCDSLYVRDLGSDGTPEILVDSMDGWGNTTVEKLTVYGWDGRLRRLGRISWVREKARSVAIWTGTAKRIS